MSAAFLDALHARLLERAAADPSDSYTAKLIAAGPSRVAKKLGEEAVETVIEAASGDRDGLVAESADLVYHLMVLWIAAGIDPEAVWAELAKRQGMSGLEEKRSRADGDDHGV